ncbi:MAG: hypothetical protein AAGB34_03890 [Planctomycetota bacterium]
MTAEITFYLAQSSASPGSRSDVLAITIGIIVIAVIGVGAVTLLFAFKRRVFRDNDSRGGGFSLGELRRLREQGELNEEEYEQARSAVIGLQRGGTNEIRRLREQRQSQPENSPPPSQE